MSTSIGEIKVQALAVELIYCFYFADISKPYFVEKLGQIQDCSKRLQLHWSQRNAQWQ